jgi:hypothetical protein
VVDAVLQQSDALIGERMMAFQLTVAVILSQRGSILPRHSQR